MNENGWIDISIPVFQGMVHWPGDPEFESRQARSLERKDECNLTQFSTCAHIGTHMDAPLHFIPDGASIDQAPLDALMGACRIIEIHDHHAIRPAELDVHNIQPGERVLFKTRNSAREWVREKFIEDFVYISKEAARSLVDRHVRTVGVDYLSIGGFLTDGVETHQILLGASVWVIEGLNLSQVTPGDYELVCLPLKLRGSDGAPARAVVRPLRQPA